MSLDNELTYIRLLDETCIRYRQARTLWHQRETQLVDAIVDLTSFKQLESGGLRDIVDQKEDSFKLMWILLLSLAQVGTCGRKISSAWTFYLKMIIESPPYKMSICSKTEGARKREQLTPTIKSVDLMLSSQVIYVSLWGLTSSGSFHILSFRSVYPSVMKRRCPHFYECLSRRRRESGPCPF